MSPVLACFIPQPIWVARTDGGPSLEELSAEVLACERRAAKRIDTGNQLAKHSLAAGRIEDRLLGVVEDALCASVEDAESRLSCGQIAYLDYPETLVEALYSIGSGDASDAACRTIHAPERLREAQDALSKSTRAAPELTAALAPRQEALSLAVRAGCALVEVADLSRSAGKSAPDACVFERRDDEATPRRRLPATALSRICDLLTRSSVLTASQRRQALSLLGEIIEAVARQGAVTLGGRAKHEVITEVLHSLVFARDIPKTAVRLAYVDGSEAMPFPIGLARLSDAEPNARRLSAVLMSIRHQDMDASVDFCWFRNSEVSTRGSMAERDAFCARHTEAMILAALARGSFVLDLHHTGHEPAVVGFYRGLVAAAESLRADGTRAEVAVVPHYFRGEGDVPGTPWNWGQYCGD